MAEPAAYQPLSSGIYPGRTGFYGAGTTSLIVVSTDGGDGTEFRLTIKEAVALAGWLLRQATAASPPAGEA